MQREGSRQVNTLPVAPTANLAGGRHELNPVGLACKLGILTLLVLARDCKRRAVALVGAKANGAGRGEKGAEGGIDDDGAAAEEG